MVLDLLRGVNVAKFSYNLRFPGQYFDAETGKHYNYFRDYDPAIGRYIESDPIGLNAGTNTFSYVAGAPLRYSDRLGLDFFDWLGEKWRDFRGKMGGDVGKDFSADMIGRLQGAKCAKNCQRFQARRDKNEIATEICLELMPHVQGDPIAGNTVLQKCVEHCVRLLGENCKTGDCQKGK